MTETEAPAPVLSEIHRAYLNEHAVSDEVIDAQGIRSEGDTIVFTWREGGHVTEQRRPWPGGAGVYYWTAGEDLHLNVLRDPGPDAPVLLCEGTKQSLAVASWAPEEYAVMGMPGCYGWTMSRKLDLARFAGRQVLVMLDADASDNLDVYEAGTRLASELEMEDPPASALFIPSPAWGKDGIDDYLGRIAPERRTDRLAKLITRAQGKPADRKPARRKAQAPDTGGRPMILVDGDRRDAIRAILGAMSLHWNGTLLFNYGGVFTRLREARTEPLNKGAFLRWLSEGVSCFRQGGEAGYLPAWPDQQSIEALMASADEFTPLDRVTAVPFLRADGTVCAKNGYDTASRTMLVTGNSGMDRLDIPDNPSAGDAAAAVAYLTGDWLGDMPFRDQPSRANALGLIITPFIRGLVPLVPLAVISGLQMGVGKNLLADCMTRLVTGDSSVPLPWIPDDDDEMRKQIMSAFRGGQSLVCFDEAHVISGTALSRALTALTYGDRILGVSEMAYYPNKMTWLALGNQVQVLGDMARRYYVTELYPEGPDPQDRPETSFAHPDLPGWTTGHRPELITMVLTVIRAWFAAGCPAAPSRGGRMGSFEAWDRMVSGILAHAGVEGFLGNLTARRAERDTTGGYWNDHLAWLLRIFGHAAFTALDVKSKAMAASGDWDAPPRLDEPADRGFTRNLGVAYSQNKDRWYGALRIVKTGTGHGTKGLWRIDDGNDGPRPAEGNVDPDLGGMKQDEVTNPRMRDEGDEAGHSPARTGARAHDTRAHTRAHVGGGEASSASSFIPGFALCADIETGSAGDLFTYTQRDETGYVRLAGLIGSAGTPAIVSAPQALEIFSQAAVITGHNILGFDGLALAWHHRRDDPGWWESFASKARDTELIARQVWPPQSKETHSDDKLGLDNVAALLGLPGKTGDLKRLKAKYGGYDRIPLDDPEYRAYLEGDLRATAAVAGQLLGCYDSDPYIPREHRAAAVNGRMSLNGVRVDQGLLRERLAAGEERKRACLQALHDIWGLPLGKTVSRGRGKAKAEVFEEAVSPLSTDYGRDWLARMWEAYQIPDPPRTAKTGKLALGADDLKLVLDDPRCTGGLRQMLELMAVVTGTRTVYQTAQACLCPDGRVHPSVSMRQASGRSSTTNPGLTVFGKHGGRHVERDIFVPDEGFVLMSFDLSQVDMRAVAGHSQDPAYMALFEPGRDAHAEIAARVFGDPHGGHCPKDCELRQAAKSRGHGWNYGMGPERMIRDGVAPDVAYGFDNGMRAEFGILCAWREGIRARAAAGEILDNGFGRHMKADPARAHTVGPALMGQGPAADILKEWMLACPRELDRYRLITVHDEQVFQFPEDSWEEMAREVVRAAEGDFMGVPILVDQSGPGLSWGEISAK